MKKLMLGAIVVVVIIIDDDDDDRSNTLLTFETLEKILGRDLVNMAVLWHCYDIFLSRLTNVMVTLVYLRTSPEKCMERIKRRSRDEETSVSMVRVDVLFHIIINNSMHLVKFNLNQGFIFRRCEKEVMIIFVCLLFLRNY